MIATGISRVQRARPADAGTVVAGAATISLLPGRRPLRRSRTASATRFGTSHCDNLLKRLPARQLVNMPGAHRRAGGLEAGDLPVAVSGLPATLRRLGRVGSAAGDLAGALLAQRAQMNGGPGAVGPQRRRAGPRRCARPHSRGQRLVAALAVRLRRARLVPVPRHHRARAVAGCPTPPARVTLR